MEKEEMDERIRAGTWLPRETWSEEYRGAVRALEELTERGGAESAPLVDTAVSFGLYGLEEEMITRMIRDGSAGKDLKRRDA